MGKRKTLEQIKKNFNDDLKKKLNPLYDIQQSVSDDTLKELKELFEAVGNFAYERAKKESKKQ